MDSDDCSKHQKNYKNTVIESLVSGSISSTITTVVYQPLELLKTRMQLNSKDHPVRTNINNRELLLGRATKSAAFLVKNDGVLSLWRGTGASLLRSGPGVGLYYALLNVLQSNFSSQHHRPDDPTQAFYFGLTARSMVSFVLLPVTVIKVRYESGKFNYPSLMGTIRAAYTSSNGWVGLTPTVIRDSLFSGTYYMCYTKLKSEQGNDEIYLGDQDKKYYHLRIFSYGLVSGLVASLITNPIDVVKTNIQVASNGRHGRVSMGQVVSKMLSEQRGFLRFFDGLVPRSARRTLISATTWTFYELLIDLVQPR